MKDHVIAVAGAACKAKNLAPLRAIAEQLTDSKHISYVDGVMFVDGQPEVVSPSQQRASIQEVFAHQGYEKSVIISQSMGAFATVDTLLESPLSRGIIIAPPLPSPVHLLQSSTYHERTVQRGDVLMVPSYSLSDDQHNPEITPVALYGNVIEDVEALSDTFSEKVQDLVEQKRLGVVVPSRDWNRAAVDSASLYQATIVEGTHSLYTDDANLFARNTQIIADLALEKMGV